MVYCEIPHNRG